MAEDTIVWVYDPSKNREGGFLPGVPLRSLTTQDWESLSKWQQASVDAAPFYYQPKPRAKNAPTSTAEEGQKDG